MCFAKVNGLLGARLGGEVRRGRGRGGMTVGFV